MRKAISSHQYSQFLNWLKTGRINRGLTIRQLAELLDEHASVIGKIETGQRRLDIYEYCQYCEVLKLDLIEGLVFLSGNKSGEPPTGTNEDL